MSLSFRHFRSLTMLVFCVVVGKAYAQNVNATWGSNSASAWYISANWAGGAYAGVQGIATINSNIATFTGSYTGTTVGINMGTASLNLGAVSIDNTRSLPLNIGNSSSITAGELRLYGTTVNSVANVILRNNSTGLLTLQANQSGLMGVVLSNPTDNIINIDGTGGITISSIISGAGNLTKAGVGSGVLILSNSGNTYSGITTINTGFIRVTDENSLGKPPSGFVFNHLTLNGGGIRTNGASFSFNSNRGVLLGTGGGTFDAETGRTITINNVIAGPGKFTKTGTGSTVMAGDHTFTGGVSINAGVVSVSTINNEGLAGNVGAADNDPNNLLITGGTLQYTGPTASTDRGFKVATANSVFEISQPLATLTISGIFSGTGTLTKVGSGTLLLSGASDFIGNINVNAGIIKAGATNWAFGAQSAISLANVAGVNLDITGFDNTIGSLTGGGASGGNITLDTRALTIGIDNTSPAAYAGVISGVGGAITKSGTGTLILSGENTYTNITTVTDGTLQLNNPAGRTLPATNNVNIFGGTLRVSQNQTIKNFGMGSGTLIVDAGKTLTITGTYDVFGGTINNLGIIKFTGDAVTFPGMAAVSNMVGIEVASSTTVTLSPSLAITGSLVLTSGTLNIAPGVLLDLNGASLSALSGYLTGSSTSDLTVRGTTGGTVTLPTVSEILLRTVTIGNTRTLAMNGSQNIKLSGALTIATGATYDNGGESQITQGTGGTININGRFITRDKDGFSGDNTSITAGFSPILNAGSTVEYGLATGGPQAVTSRSDYKNITFSGSGTKSLSGPFDPTGTVFITGLAIVNAANHTFGNLLTTNLTMDGGRLRLSGTSNPQPHMGGTYNLTGGVVEFANNNISGQTIRSRTYQNIEVTGADVRNSGGNIALNDLGTFIIKNGGIFLINSDAIVGTIGTQTLIVESGGIFKCGNALGFNGPAISLNSPAVRDNIEIVTLASGSTVEYSRSDIQDITNTVPYSNLTISGTTGIKTARTGTLTINGNFLKTGASSFAHNSGNVLFNNTMGTQSFTNIGTTAFNFYDLTNSNSFGTGLSIQNSLGIANALTLSAGSKLNLVAGDITLQSTATNTARVATMPATAAISYSGTGQFIVERYYNGRRGWRLATAPLSETPSIFNSWQLGGVAYNVSNALRGMLVTGPGATPGSTPGPNGLDDSPLDNSSMKTFNSTTGLYVDVLNTRDSSLSRNFGSAPFNIGYYMFVRGDRNPNNTIIPNITNTTLSASGKLQTGAMTFDISNATLPDGFALLGNPYASPISFETLGKLNVQDQFTVLDPYFNTDQGAYVSIIGDGLGNYSVSALRPGGQVNEFLQSGQAFFVRRTAASASLTFTETDKSTIYSGGLMRPSSGSPIPSFRTVLNLLNDDNSIVLADGNLVDYGDVYDNRIDDYDALKFSNINETVGLVRDGKNISVERRKTVTADDTLFFKLAKTTKRRYQFQFIPTALDPLLTAFLEDGYTGIKTPVSVMTNSIYGFNINDDAASAAPGRFRIVFKTGSGGPVPVTYSSIKAYRQGRNINVEWRVENELNISKYEVEKSTDGVNFNKVNTTTARGANSISTTYTWRDANAVLGENFYRIRSIELSGKTQYSRIVKVSTGMAEPAVSVYPNPVTGSIIGLQFDNMPAGIYQVRLINIAGQLMSNHILIHPGGSAIEAIVPPKKLTSGMYQVEVVKPGREKAVIKVLVN